MEDKFKQLIKDVVQPLMKEAGFKKKALNFYKIDDGLIFLVNFQKSHGNYYAELGFYINCAIHSHAIDEELGEKVNEFPKEYQCHFVKRIEEISGTASDKFMIDSTTDIEVLKEQLKTSLVDVINYFSKIKDVESFVELMSKNGTRQEDEVFRFCVRKGYNEAAENLAELYHTNIDAERWEDFFKERFLEILEEEESDLKIDCLQ